MSARFFRVDWIGKKNPRAPLSRAVASWMEARIAAVCSSFISQEPMISAPLSLKIGLRKSLGKPDPESLSG